MTPLHLFCEEKTQWNNIKGNDETGHNPAEKFFNKLIDEYFGDYSFVRNLMLPEAKIDDIFYSSYNMLTNQAVDFYLPQGNLVIEIDGSQHKEPSQMKLDEKRDKYLNKNGIYVVRIDVSDLENENKRFKEKIAEILKILKRSDRVENYRKALFSNENTIKTSENSENSENNNIEANNNEHTNNTNNKERYDLEVIIRFQLLLLSLLQRGVIDIEEEEWEFFIKSPNSNDKNLFAIATEDLFLYIENLCGLGKLKFNRPKIVLKNEKSSNNCISIDFDLFKRWDESYIDWETIFIRNDYFDNFVLIDDKNNEITYPYDFFKISTGKPIKYNIEEGDFQINNLLFFLKEIFGFDKFREGQLSIIKAELNMFSEKKKGMIGILPTGAGKSICYIYCCLLQPSTTLVVEPIISLMIDQKRNLFSEFGIDRSSYISSMQSGEEKEIVIEKFKKGKYLFIWTSPERFQTVNFREALGYLDVIYVIIDEVHCLSEWGHDFRVSYLTLTKTIKKYFEKVKLVGLTATASQFVLNDLKFEFNISSEDVKSVYSMNRDELHFSIIKERKGKKLYLVSDLLKNRIANMIPNEKKEISSGIIFTINVNGPVGCRWLVNMINNFKIIKKEFKTKFKTKKFAAAYYGGLKSEKKKQLQADFINDEIPLIVGTKSLGMGLNKKNIDFTIHYSLPYSLESFYQEAGRAGRNKQKSDCYIIYSPEKCDKKIIEEIFSINTSPERLKKINKAKFLKNDLSSIFYLWNKSNDTIENDLKNMQWVLDQLENDNLINLNPKYDKLKVERALYRLYLLGMVEDWTIRNWDKKNGSIFVKICDYSEKTVFNHLDQYIRKYDSDYNENRSHERYERFHDALSDINLTQIDRYMKALLSWTFDNINYSRRMSIKTIYDICEENRGDEYLKEFIDEYFTFTEDTIVLDNISQNPREYSLWFDVLSHTNIGLDRKKEKLEYIKMKEAEALIAKLMRYIESYRYNTGLNYLFGILNLYCKRSDWKERLNLAFEDILNYEESIQENILEETLNFGENFNEEEKILLSEFLIERYPNKIENISNNLNDLFSLSILLTKRNEKLSSILDTIEELK
ncbi:MAG: RecQ family ATP-dependent DNA helicase [Methanobrevibacter sp.]|jgi:ATP-dependent DNA helicase RecQ|nr:RecQ family ATP-dependent DNA helicase [Methanobrevibacter sp.]